MSNEIKPLSRFGSESAAKPPRLLARRACLWSTLGLLAVLAFAAPPTRAAVTEAWVQRYDGPANGEDRANAVAVDAGGNVVVTGYSDNGTNTIYYTAKYGPADGALLWEKRIRGPALGGAETASIALVMDGGGNVVLAGTSNNGTNDDWFTAKYAAVSDALLWEKRYDDIEVYLVAVDGSGSVVVAAESFNGTHDDYYLAKYAAADGTLLWESRSRPTNRDVYPTAVAVDGNGNVLVISYGIGDFHTTKYAAANGALLWEQRYNGTGNGRDAAIAVAVDGSGNVVVTGTSSPDGSVRGNDYYTAKYAAANGALVWEKRYNGQDDDNDQARAVAVDGSGNAVVTGYSFHNDGTADYYTAMYAAANGALFWENRYNGPANSDDYAEAVAVDGSGNVVVTGFSDNGSNLDYYTAKYAALDGALLWEQRYNGPANGDDHAVSLALGPNGTVAVTGSSSATNGTADYATVVYRVYVPVTEAWVHRYNGPANSNDYANAVAVDGRGNVVVTGASDNGTNWDYYTAKYAAADGALLWEKRYNGPANSYDEAYAVTVDGSGNVIVTGSSISSGSEDYYTAKYAAADGALLWENRYNGPGNDEDDGNAIVVDAGGNVVVTGGSDNGTNDDYYTARYAAADGALLWEKRYNGPGNNSDIATAIALDRSGNVVVTGQSIGSGSGYDYYTAKYAEANGALLWEKRYNGPANGYDFASAVAIDSNGNVVVTGGSHNGTNYDYYTAKYAAMDGVLLWEHRYNGPANGNDFAYAAAIDSNGNVVVTGYSDNGTNTDYYTAKYAAADGALLWEKRYNSPANGDDAATAVAADASGNAVVTGWSHNGINYDYCTVKYAAADGALLWEKRYNGPANEDDLVSDTSSLALGPNGMVVITGHSIGSSGSYDFATVVYRETLPAVSIARVPTGVSLRFPGVAGHSYQVLRAPAVTGPWSTNATLTAVTNGVIEYLDTNAPPGSAFYRTATAP